MKKETDKCKSEGENRITVMKIKIKIKCMLGGIAQSARDVEPRDFFYCHLCLKACGLPEGVHCPRVRLPVKVHVYYRDK